jgi:pimeloyl-ACP methyl ester carboxylesterase
MSAGETEIVFRSGRDRIHGTLRRPKHRGRRPLALLVHGFGSFRNELTGFAELSERLAAVGIASLRLDMHGCGKSGKRGLMHPAPDWIEDLRNAVSFGETLPAIDADRVGIIGMSMGGGIATIAAALDLRLKAVVALAPVADGKAWFQHLWTSSAGDRRWQAFQRRVAKDRQQAVVSGRSEMVDVLDAMNYAPADRDAFRHMAKTYPAFLRRITLSAVDSAFRVSVVPFAPLIGPRPLLVIHSRADTSVPHEQGEAIARAAGRSARLILIDDSPHCFWLGRHSVAVQEQSRDWLVRHL